MRAPNAICQTDMTPRPVDETTAHRKPQHRLRFELIFGSLWLAAGLFAMPALVYWVGASLLGPYADGAGIGTFYGNFFGDLASGSIRAWTLALGPLVLVYLLRLVFLRRPEPAASDDEDAAPRQPASKAAAGRPDRRRVEPRVSLD